ncbi:MAG: hypothetical protein ACI8XB_002934 [Patiriisocius sp.]|jgi:hypothetical protein
MFKIYGIILLFLFGCNSDSSIEKMFKEHSPDGELLIKQKKKLNTSGEKVLISEEVFIQDSLLHGVRKSYFLETGQLRFIENYKFGELEGDQYYYHLNGQLKEKFIFQNNKANGVNRKYYEDGKLESINRWIGGRLIGEQVYYNPNESLRKYVFNDPEGNPVYQRTYNENDENYSEGGVISTFVVIENFEGKLFSNEPINIVVFVPSPTDCSVNVKLSVLDRYQLNELVSISTTAKKGKADFEILLDAPETYYLKVEAVFFESDFNKIELENTEFHFEVI